MATTDPNQQAAEKLNKETKAAQAAQQASFDKASEAVRTGKIQPPTENDMGPLPKKEPVKKYKKGGMVSSASKRADGCCSKGKTRGRIV
jgi:hypothetical protein